MEPLVSKMTRSGTAYFTIAWSRLLPLEKQAIRGRIPSTAGIFEVYDHESGPTAALVGRARAYYGGLRNTLRGIVDPISPYPLNGELLDPDREYLVRYSLTNSSADMDDILFFFAGREPLRDPDQDHSGRYDCIYIKEQTPEAQPGEIQPAE